MQTESKIESVLNPPCPAKAQSKSNENQNINQKEKIKKTDPSYVFRNLSYVFLIPFLSCGSIFFDRHFGVWIYICTFMP